MKKVFFSIALMLVVFTTGAFASGNYAVFYKLNNKSTFNSVMRYLQADYTQANDLQYVFSLTEKRLESVKDGDSEAMAKVLRFNLVNAKTVLTPAQYKKYLVLLNVSVQNQDADFIAEK